MSEASHLISAVVLAAGSSTRMAAPHKLLLEIEGKPIIVHTIAYLQNGGVDEIVVVLGYEKDRIRPLLPPDVKIVINPNYQQGMASSIACGAQSLSPRTAAAFISLADMPLISKDTIRNMLRLYHDSAKPAIVAPYYLNKQGNPVLFDYYFFPELLKLVGDKGAKSLLNKYKKNLIRFDCNDSAILLDIDTKQAYERLRWRKS